MLRAGIDNDRLVSHGFLIAIDIAPDVSLDHVRNMLADATSWIEGVGKAEVEHLGALDTYDAEQRVGENVV